MISRTTIKRFQSTISHRPVPVRDPNAGKKYKFYDLVMRTSSHPTHPIEASLMSTREYEALKKKTKTTFEGNYSIDNSLTPEEKIAKIFGGRIKGEARVSSSRITRGEGTTIAGIDVPARPPEPDNCCMSGCINCVWEMFDEDLKEWNDKRILAAKELVKAGGRWPENFHAPLKYLKRENYPESIMHKSEAELKEEQEEASRTSDEDDSWGGVPVAIRVFAEVEKKLKEKRLARAGASELNTSSIPTPPHVTQNPPRPQATA
ncbi:uncharacterized protein J8A68_001106 [[Candida] subhashii]|uniref:Oxidoreductase-like domain-containing protein n=1 Tax=[Candida] subhashii TaxID=561895 RepID=A0A8J5UKE2_9ASCO|nr:uncharacterized protein J8A68_001106 [[Candida] subhashii]KAG7665418.1 hypothetical protein J8A68_001106 [[Candida] subhashii]